MLKQLTHALRHRFNTHAVSDLAAHDVALLVIDVQRDYCSRLFGRGNNDTRDTTARLLSALPHFRALGIPVYPVYTRDEPDEAPGFYKFRPAPGDKLLRKTDDNAFYHTNTTRTLRDDGRQTLLMCGFNLNACVKATALGALYQKFDVRVLRDLSGNDCENPSSFTCVQLRQMQDAGVIITDSQQELQNLRRLLPDVPHP